MAFRIPGGTRSRQGPDEKRFQHNGQRLRLHPTTSSKDSVLEAEEGLESGRRGEGVPQFLPLQNGTSPAKCGVVPKTTQHKGCRCIQHAVAIGLTGMSFLFSLPGGSWRQRDAQGDLGEGHTPCLPVKQLMRAPNSTVLSVPRAP